MYKIDELWTTLKIKLIYHQGDIYRYLYSFDNDNEEDGGIIEFDCFVIKEIIKDSFSEYIFKMFRDQRVNVCKKINNQKFITKNGIDLASIMTLFFIYKEYLKKQEFPKKIECLNFKNIEKLKFIFPKEYNEVKNMINEKRFVS